MLICTLSIAHCGAFLCGTCWSEKQLQRLLTCAGHAHEAGHEAGPKGAADAAQQLQHRLPALLGHIGRLVVQALSQIAQLCFKPGRMQLAI